MSNRPHRILAPCARLNKDGSTWTDWVEIGKCWPDASGAVKSIQLHPYTDLAGIALTQQNADVIEARKKGEAYQPSGNAFAVIRPDERKNERDVPGTRPQGAPPRGAPPPAQPDDLNDDIPW